MSFEEKLEEVKEFCSSASNKRGVEIAILLVTILLTTWILVPSGGANYSPEMFVEGTVSEHTVKAASDFSYKPTSELPSQEVKRGQVIVREGDVISQSQAAALTMIDAIQKNVVGGGGWIGYLVVSGIILASSYLFLYFFWPHLTIKHRDLVLIATVIVALSALFKFFVGIGGAFTGATSTIDETTFALLTPAAMGGILLQVTLGPAAVLLFILSFGFVAGLHLQDPWLFILLASMGNLVGAISVRHCSRRSSFIRAGTRVAAVNVVLLVCMMLVHPALSLTDGLLKIVVVITSGLLAGVLASGVAPIVEHVGGFVTDIKLLELASLDRPLLRELSLRAPGTLNHSMVIGQMSEVAAEAIGANSLLTRVAAYYHDIGKMKKPDYFVENQKGKENKHNKLTPSMSALIIKAHVKDGIELARQHNLPNEIIDFIPQHHGTSLIKYFYDKAIQDAEEGEEVDESHYRYPGPRPQTRETGILMLADGIEAAARTLNDPTPAKIQGLVQKMINNIFASGQLNECPLTLRDLHEIAKSFTRVLTGMYHRRVEYSEPAEKTKAEGKEKEPKDHEKPSKAAATRHAKKEEKNGSRDSASTDGEVASAEGNGKKSDEETNKEALKRLGIT